MTTSDNATEAEVDFEVAARVHPFERAGLGKAPFRYLGLSEKVYVAHQGATPQPGGCCDYCANGIRYCCHIGSADGKKFIVGCDCVMKLERETNDDSRLIDRVEAARKVIERKNAAARNAARKAREAARIDAAMALMGDESVREALAAMPHPTFKGSDASMLIYVEWMARNAGNFGKLKVAAIIEKAAGVTG